MSHVETYAAPSYGGEAGLSVMTLDGRVAADRFYEEEIDIFGTTKAAIAEGSSLSPCGDLSGTTPDGDGDGDGK
jgi:hypothetical protein